MKIVLALQKGRYRFVLRNVYACEKLRQKNMTPDLKSKQFQL